MIQGHRTRRETALMAERKPPFKGAIWFGHEWGWGVKPTKKITLFGKVIS